MANLDSVLAIDGNAHVLGRLRDLVASGRAVAFAGAGASAGMYPLWDELVRLLIDETVARGLASDADRAAWLGIAKANPQQVVRGLREKLGRQVYGAVLRRVFGSRTGSDGRPYTETQGLLLALPFLGYVTTNYDPGLLEARRERRPDVPATGYATWRDQDALRDWYTGDVFEKEACPILYAHGVHERTDTIVLGAGEYREAYRPGLFREVVRRLWGQEHLVFVGFGFSDTWFGVVAEEALALTAHDAAGEPRHVAITGLPEGDSYSPELRAWFRDAYGAEVLLYPVKVTERDGVRREDHGLLAGVLAELGGAAPARLPAGPPPAASPPVERWVHETTEDERYVEPGAALARLDRWAADSQVRAIGITGIGGLGKTALAGRWLKRPGGPARQVRGLFAWSFYANPLVADCLEALAGFAAKELDAVMPPPGRPAARAVAALRAAPLAVLLDGLEELQEPPEELQPETAGWLEHGQFLDPDLRTFLDDACRLDHGGLILLTSRFPFADLTPYLGTGLRLLELERLTPAEGGRLLAGLGVCGSEGDREASSRRLEGHPLALKVLAAALARQARSDPTRLLDVAFAPGDMDQNDPLEGKVRRLLAFYEEQLPGDLRAVLGVVALFPDQVGLPEVLRLAAGLPVAAVLRGATDSALRAALGAMVADGLLVRERGDDGEERFACHPVVRAHFRSALLGQDRTMAAQAADLLAGRHTREVRSREQLAVVTNAVALLLEGGEVRRADELYQGSLGVGHAFTWLPAPREGVRCALGFVTSLRQHRLAVELPGDRLAFYLSEVGLHAMNAAEFDRAESCMREVDQLNQEAGGIEDRATGLRNLTELLAHRGRLPQAEATARKALVVARSTSTGESVAISLAHLGWVLGMQGWTAEACAAFDEASELQRRRRRGAAGLYSLRGIQWADLLRRLDRTAESRELTEANLVMCERREWQQDVARCRWMLGRLDLLAGHHEPAAAHLTAAARTFRDAQQLPEMADVLLAQAGLARLTRTWEEARARAEEALRLAATRGMGLRHADALVLRGRIGLDEHGTERALEALDDADTALTLARHCGYAWAECDALALRADARAVLGEGDGARGDRLEVEALDRRLRPPVDPA